MFASGLRRHWLTWSEECPDADVRRGRDRFTADRFDSRESRMPWNAITATAAMAILATASSARENGA